MNEMMTERVMITNEMIEAGKSGMGGWNRRQVEAIGMAGYWLEKLGNEVAIDSDTETK